MENCSNGYPLDMLELHLCNTNHTCFEDNTELYRNHILFPVLNDGEILSGQLSIQGNGLSVILSLCNITKF